MNQAWATPSPLTLINSPDCPEFPDSKWKNIILGRSVNLDVIYAGLFATANMDFHTETVGKIEFIYSGAIPSKTIKNGGE
jgi:hypothetical protein